MATVRLDQIRAADWQPKMGELGAVVEGADDVLQCIRTILLTPRGSVPHEPTFGSGILIYLDWPLSTARPHIIRDALDALARWEPRMEVSQITVEWDEEIGHVRLTVNGRLVQGSAVTAVVEIVA